MDQTTDPNARLAVLNQYTPGRTSPAEQRAAGIGMWWGLAVFGCIGALLLRTPRLPISDNRAISRRHHRDHYRVTGDFRRTLGSGSVRPLRDEALLRETWA